VGAKRQEAQDNLRGQRTEKYATNAGGRSPTDGERGGGRHLFLAKGKGDKVSTVVLGSDSKIEIRGGYYTKKW